jgi:prepilin-type N-terminal cleavage/methylation domain-containing protein
MSRSDAGFTLLEVMAAVAVVAIVFTTLARVANQGVQSEGISKRRLEASLLADEVLSDLEDQMAAGMAPEIGKTETEEGPFAVVVDVTPFDLASVIPESVEDTASESGSSEPDQPPAAPGPAASAVREIEIEVTWIEGVDEFRVTRSSFGLDLASIQPLLDAQSGGIPGLPNIPGLENLPNIPGLQNLPNLQNLPGLSNTGEVPR